MNFSLIPNYQNTWDNTRQYAVQLLFGTEPLTYITPAVVYNGNLYIANYTDGENPPVGVNPDTSPLWTLFSTQSGGGVAFEAIAIATANITIASPGDTDWDGVTPTIGDSVFLLPVASGGNQTTASEGGLYTYNGPAVPLTRYVGMDTWPEVVGSRVFINAGGSTFGNTAWLNTNSLGGTLDVTPITYIQTQNTYVAGTNMVLVGNVFSTSLVPSFTSEALTDDTNFLLTGTTNTMTWTMASLTSPRTFTLPDANSNPIRPITATPGSAVQFIDNTGLQNLMVIINQVLTGFTPTVGTVTAADTILQAIEKLAATTSSGYSVVHDTVNHQFLASQITVIMDSDAKTGTLPAADGTGVIPGVTYTLKLGTGATTGTLAVPLGQSLNGVLNGTFAISGADNSASAQSDATGWYTV